jgi:hypothetical protein
LPPNFQQQPQGFRLPSPNQPQAPGAIRPPLVPNVRPLVNPQQAPNIRNLPPQQPPIRGPAPLIQNPQQFRPPPQQIPLQQQQGFPPRPPFVPDQQFRPQVPLQQRPPEPQKIIRPPPPGQNNNNNSNMMAEINREKTFTANNNGEQQQSVDDDDDDVVVGRMNTPQSKNGQKPVDSYGKGVPRRESEQSIPSRPASGLGSHQSVSPEPRSPGAMQQQQQQQQFINNNRPGDFTNEVQRPAMRQSPEDMNRSKMPPNIQSNLPFTKPNMLETEVRKGAQDMKKSVELDLGRPVTFQSTKHHSPSKIVHDFVLFFL